MSATVRIVVRITDEATKKRRWVTVSGKKSDPQGPHYLRYGVGPRYEYAGDRYDIAFAEKIKLERRLKAAELGAVIQNEPAAPTPAPTPQTRHKMLDLVDAYILAESKPDKNGDVRSKKCLNPYRSEVTSFVGWSKKTYVDQITRELMTEYRDWLLSVGRDGEPYEVDTVRNKLMTLLVIFKNNGVVSIAPILPTSEFPDKKVTVPDPLTREEFDAFMQHAPYEDALRIYAYMSTGMRDQEWMNAEKADIDWELGVLHIVKKRDRGWKGKSTAALRSVPLNDDLLAELRLRPEGLLFPAPAGGVDRHFGERSVKPIALKAGIVPTTAKPHQQAVGAVKDDPLHRFRDSYISNQLHLHCKTWGDVMDLCERIGHSAKSMGQTLVKYKGKLKHPYEPVFPERYRRAKGAKEAAA